MIKFYVDDTVDIEFGNKDVFIHNGIINNNKGFIGFYNEGRDLENLDYEVVMTFSNIKSIETVIGALEDLKKFMIDKGIPKE